MEAVRPSMTYDKVSRRRGRSGLACAVDFHHGPSTLPTSSDDFDGEFILGGRQQIVNHDVEVGRVAIRVSVPFRCCFSGLDGVVTYDIKAGVRYDLVPRQR